MHHQSFDSYLKIFDKAAKKIEESTFNLTDSFPYHNKIFGDGSASTMYHSTATINEIKKIIKYKKIWLYS